MNKIFVSLILAAIFLVPGAAQAQTGKWRDIAMGSGHCLVLKSDGTLWAFGQKQNGQLGDGTTTPHEKPVKILSNVKSMDCGTTHTMAVLNDGTLYAWGANNSRQLGLGFNSRELMPTRRAVP